MNTTTLRRKTDDSLSIPKKILYLDDDMQSRLLVKHLIGKNYHLTLVPDAEEALKRLKQEVFDLILLDIRLEGEMTGIDVLKKIRQMPWHEGVPVIALTAFAFEEDKRYLLASGFTDYVPKPIDIRAFKDKIYDYIENNPVLS
jgi:CheY-like chemotaxis protein